MLRDSHVSELVICLSNVVSFHLRDDSSLKKIVEDTKVKGIEEKGYLVPLSTDIESLLSLLQTMNNTYFFFI